jgi:hypothetical protein
VSRIVPDRTLVGFLKELRREAGGMTKIVSGEPPNSGSLWFGPSENRAARREELSLSSQRTNSFLPYKPLKNFHLPARQMGKKVRCHDFATTS